MAAWDYLDYMNPQRKRTLWPQPYDPATAQMQGIQPPGPELVGPDPVQPDARPSLPDGILRQQQAAQPQPMPADVEPPEPAAPPMSTQAQDALRARMAERDAAEQRMKNMSTGRKILGGVLEGIGASRRGPLGGLARVGGGAITGRNAVEEIDRSLPAYDRAADNERIANAQAENAQMRRDNTRRMQTEAAERNKTRLLELQTKPGMEEITDANPYDPKVHAGEPTEYVPGRKWAKVRPDVLEGRETESKKRAEMRTWRPVPKELRPYIPEEFETAPQSTLDLAIRLKELDQQKAIEADRKVQTEEQRHAERIELAKRHEELMKALSGMSAGNRRFDQEAQVYSQVRRALNDDTTHDPKNTLRNVAQFYQGDRAMDEVRPQVMQVLQDMVGTDARTKKVEGSVGRGRRNPFEKGGAPTAGASAPAASAPSSPATGMPGDLPDPANYPPGSIVQNRRTGQRMKTDGTKWLPAQ